jgi:hypothetical protein
MGPQRNLKSSSAVLVFVDNLSSESKYVIVDNFPPG